MKFDVFGGFTVTWKGANAQFWQSVEEQRNGLSRAFGCYIFAIRNGRNFMPWYIGKTARQAFRDRFSSRDHRRRLTDLAGENGELQIFLLAAQTPGGSFMSPKENEAKEREIDYLETMLIGIALRRNMNIRNIAITTMLRNMSVPGMINNRPGMPTRAVRDLRNVLGI